MCLQWKYRIFILFFQYLIDSFVCSLPFVSFFYWLTVHTLNPPNIMHKYYLSMIYETSFPRKILFISIQHAILPSPIGYCNYKLIIYEQFKLKEINFLHRDECVRCSQIPIIIKRLFATWARSVGPVFIQACHIVVWLFLSLMILETKTPHTLTLMWTG